ncbi:hypothetical protein HOP50_01g08260 [Chloropicon primus]|uniref:FAS1 domain-containing protein n=2 Tax=Chloropicon primus TaxID=1764295 RepID=A0A5B8MG53_9CHLO|nr:hypothetical protein A3770_01p08380 [Chloropicon primus]UPQ97531.1 hypothetical protein HOP50_01g08260 [Chloropicon primus]|eukprot:QDZ18320.1 hypothetical protein A3770_01p08380 [Chloropicon primus]
MQVHEKKEPSCRVSRPSTFLPLLLFASSLFLLLLLLSPLPCEARRQLEQVNRLEGGDANAAAPPPDQQQQQVVLLEDPPGASDVLTSYLEGSGRFSLFVRSLRHFGYARALDGKEPKRKCSAFGPQPACYLFYCPPAPCASWAVADEVSKGDGPFTVLALTDDAMEAMLKARFGPSAELGEVLRSEALSERLRDVIGYHVIKGKGLRTADMGASAEAAEVATPSPSSTPPRHRFATGATLRGDNRTTGGEAVFFLGKDGRVRLHEDCTDKAPPGTDHGCHLQAEWGKCSEEWMNDRGALSGRPAGYCEVSCQRCECDSSSCTKEIAQADVVLERVNVTVHVLSAALEPPPQFEVPFPAPPPPPPPPVRPPVYVWNPYTHRQEIMAEWNTTTQSYQEPSDPTQGLDTAPEYSYDYVWNADEGEYQYVMVHKHGN